MKPHPCIQNLFVTGSCCTPCNNPSGDQEKNCSFHFGPPCNLTMDYLVPDKTRFKTKTPPRTIPCPRSVAMIMPIVGLAAMIATGFIRSMAAKES